MDLSNLRPADGSKQSDNFRRGRGHGSGNGKTAESTFRRYKTRIRRRSDAFVQKNTEERIHLQKL